MSGMKSISRENVRLSAVMKRLLSMSANDISKRFTFILYQMNTRVKDKKIEIF
ncbi:hypothetical protein Dia5BBH33_13190 [Dialister hominis]|jgi:hypothetical protein|uniref:Uncharacterized protein n=1 Tax=Dialister hominis TaxID=2582419 RepID=A0A8D4UUS8_9FIRM|nr:hypothetical protein Dia5BBH33_13190 [Dialister hominis]